MAYYEVAKLYELTEGFTRAVAINGLSVLLIHSNDRTHIIEDRCPHMDAPLRGGQVHNETIRCRAHGIAFDLNSGRASGALKDSLPCVKKFPAIYEANGIGIEL